MAKGPIALDTTGLKEFLAGLDKVERLEVGRDLKAQFGRIVDDAISRGRAKASTRGQRRAAGTLRQASTGTMAAIGFGRGFRGAFGHEYGAKQNTRRQRASGSYLGYNQFPIWRGSGLDAGYFMWPGIRAASEAGVGELADGVARIIEGAR